MRRSLSLGFRRMLPIRAFQVIRAPNVQPGLVHRIDNCPRRTFLQAAEQGRHVALFSCNQNVERRGLQDIDSGIDVAASDRLFLKSYDINPFCAHDSKRVLPFVLPNRHRRRRLVAAMKIKNLRIMDIG
jgi:hypothetical protein